MIKENLKIINNSIPSLVTLVAVSKTHSVEQITEAYDAGQRIFGENKVQELIQKQPILPSDIEWHMIGHLQTNKIKFIAPFISLIHSIDSIKLLREINKEALKHKRIIDCLLQVYIAQEDTKYGLDENELYDLLFNPELLEFKNIRIRGLMGIASYTENLHQVRAEFKILSALFKKLSTTHFTDFNNFNILSMGMSHDYSLAIEEGATMIRVGTSIFGVRDYSK